MGRTRRHRSRRAESSNPRKLDSHESFVSLCKWMSENSWKPVAKLCPATFKLTGRGLMTLRNLRVNDLIVQIPINLLLTKERVLREWPALNLFSLSTADTLTIYLLHCKKEDINQHYTSLLPKEFSLAALCTLEEIACLPTCIQDVIHHSRDQYRKKFEKLSGIWKLLSGGNLSTSDFHWAWCAVNTRAVYYKDKTGSGEVQENNMALAPYLDMLNHNSEARITAGYNLNTKCYEIRTLEPVKRYDEVFINYGPHDNVKLFIEYGFVIPKNPQAVVEFDLLLIERLFSEKLSQNKIKKKLLNQLASNGKMFCSREGLSWDAQVALTIVMMPEEEIHSAAIPYDVNVQSEDACLKAASELVVHELLLRLKDCRKKAADICNPTSSFDVAKCLLEDMQDILSWNLFNLLS